MERWSQSRLDVPALFNVPRGCATGEGEGCALIQLGVPKSIQQNVSPSKDPIRVSGKHSRHRYQKSMLMDELAQGDGSGAIGKHDKYGTSRFQTNR